MKKTENALAAVDKPHSSAASPLPLLDVATHWRKSGMHLQSVEHYDGFAIELPA
jgi:hypothetical protein